MPPGYVLHAARADDATEINDAFCRAFAMERILDAWRWKFERSPWGWHGFVARDAQGAFAGHYAMTRIAMRDGSSLMQALDSFVSEEHQRRGLFKRMGVALLEENARRGARASYGFPNAAAIPGHRTVGWEFPPPIRLFARPLRPFRGAGRFAKGGGGLEPVADAGDPPGAVVAHEDVLQRAASSSTARAFAWTPRALEWRLVERPDRAYRILHGEGWVAATTRVRFSGLEAAVVMTVQSESDARGGEALRMAAKSAKAQGCDVVLACAAELPPRVLVRAGYAPTPRTLPLIWRAHAPDAPLLTSLRLGFLEGDFF